MYQNVLKRGSHVVTMPPKIFWKMYVSCLTRYRSCYVSMKTEGNYNHERRQMDKDKLKVLSRELKYAINELESDSYLNPISIRDLIHIVMNKKESNTNEQHYDPPMDLR